VCGLSIVFLRYDTVVFFVYLVVTSEKMHQMPSGNSVATRSSKTTHNTFELHTKSKHSFGNSITSLGHQTYPKHFEVEIPSRSILHLVIASRLEVIQTNTKEGGDMNKSNGRKDIISEGNASFQDYGFG